jgi:hypothetical protein
MLQFAGTGLKWEKNIDIDLKKIEFSHVDGMQMVQG